MGEIMPGPPPGFEIEDQPKKQTGPPPGFEIDPPSDPGFLPSVGRDVRGFATGVETTVDKLGSSLPGFLGAHDPKLVEQTLTRRPQPQTSGEKFFNAVGEVAPSFAIPSLGLEGLASRAVGAGIRYMPTWMLGAVPAIEKISGAVLEGGTRGALGGAMTPGDRLSNAEMGAIAGAGLRGAGAAVTSAWNAIPPTMQYYANGVAAAAAVKTLEHLGMPNDWLVRAPVFFALWRANIMDYASKITGKVSRAPPGAVGAGVAEVFKPKGQ